MTINTFSTFRIILFALFFLGFVSAGTVDSRISAGGRYKPKLKWIKLKTESGETIKAIYGYPVTEGKHPAVIYNHGSSVRKFGYWDSVSRGYDLKDFARGLAKKGYVAIAPIRKYERLPSREGPPGDVVFHMPAEEWTEAVKEGLRIINSSVQFLRKQPNVVIDKIGIIGFSEGGLVTLFAAFDHQYLRAVVLIAPALGRSPIYRYSNAVRRVAEINSPVFVLLGRSDIPGIIDRCTNLLIPKMQHFNKDIEYRIDYPGDHGWFHKVRSEYWGDIIQFLDKNLK